MKLGKLTNAQLDNIVLSKIKAAKTKRADVVLRPDIGIDCGAISFGSESCVVSTDPITAADEKAGRLAVIVSVNDIASAGAEAVGILLTILAPPNTQLEEIERVVDDAVFESDKQNIEIIGGHTEITDAVNKIVLSAVVIGRKSGNIAAASANNGDELIMTKWAGLEGTIILAADKRECLNLTDEEYESVELLSDLLSVVSESSIASRLFATSMHDVTEGGILGAAYEIAKASGLGVTVYERDIPVLPVTSHICEELKLDPLRLIGSGSLLISHPDGKALCQALMREGIKSTIIGKLTAEGYKFVCKNGEFDLLPPDGDEIYKV